MNFDPMAAAQAFYETGGIRRRIGNLAGAEECFARAHEIGFDPQPGLALLRLAQGKAEAALTALRLAVDGERRAGSGAPGCSPRRSTSRSPSRDLETARRRARSSRDRRRTRDARPGCDRRRRRRGALRLAEGDVADALERLRRACAIWQELRLPYEAARARMLLRARAPSGGRRGRCAARAARRRRGVRTTRRRARSRERGGAARRGRPAPARTHAGEAEVLRLVASGKSNRDIAAELVISEHTVARHLQNMFTKLDVSSRSAATAFAFEHGLA